MWYKLDLSNYEPRVVPDYKYYNEFGDIDSNTLDWIQNELDNFQDSFGRPWKGWDIPELKHRLENNYTFYLILTDEEIKAWAFTDWNKKYPFSVKYNPDGVYIYQLRAGKYVKILPYLVNRYVVPKYRNQGLGSDLIWLRCNESVKQGHKAMVGWWEDWNTPAKSVIDENIFTEIKGI